ncbi:hypothetical protein RHODO2019_12055 [Rhodococcus antarcticus]|uniref:Uncharacterized protein n=1 Tax=Rhodococcus antarcticus TaxID=2987751 RepID=A0ABY6NWZ6_9NOCA|nr:hypothetical protein [Rhodococcus antarcticus]UZJ23919.1 hypothetical protein RHODO2019_12055 [Rhodococcus antarcticus]
MIIMTSTAGRTRLGAVAAPLRAGAPGAVAPSAPENDAQLRASVRPRRDL